MLSARPSCLILADPSWALRPLCGISVLERLLRILQRLGFREAMVFSGSIAPLRETFEQASWARAELALKFHECDAGGVWVAEIGEYCQSGGDRALVLS